MTANSTIIGVFKDRVAAEGAINELRTMGIADNNISYIYSDQNDKVAAADGSGSSTAAGAVSGATTGGVIGAIAGLVVANGILPGLGTLFVAGPIAAALGLTGAAATTAAGALTGAAAGGIIGALSGLGVDADQAKVYEDRVKAGEILVTAHSADPEVLRVFEKYSAEDVKQYSA